MKWPLAGGKPPCSLNSGQLRERPFLGLRKPVSQKLIIRSWSLVVQTQPSLTFGQLLPREIDTAPNLGPSRTTLGSKPRAISCPNLDLLLIWFSVVQFSLELCFDIHSLESWSHHCVPSFSLQFIMSCSLLTSEITCGTVGKTISPSAKLHASDIHVSHSPQSSFQTMFCEEKHARPRWHRRGF